MFLLSIGNVGSFGWAFFKKSEIKDCLWHCCAVEVVKWDMVGECLRVRVHGCLCIRGRNGRVKKGGIISSAKLADKLHTPL